MNPLHKDNLSVIKGLQFIVLISALLYFGKTLFIPLSFALLVSFVLYPVCLWMERKGVNKGVAIAISIISLLILGGAIAGLLLLQFMGFMNELPEIKMKLAGVLADFTSYLVVNFNITIEQQVNWFNNLANNSGTQIIPMLKDTFNSLSVTLVLLFLVPLMASLILYHRQQFLQVLYGLFSDDKRESIREVLHDVIHTYYDFIKGMLLVYFIVGSLNSIGLAIIGVPHPVLFGFVASVLTFIPYVGILAGALLPISISWIEYNSIWYPLGVILVFTMVQFLEANLIFPLAVSNRLKINSLVTIIAIIAGWILWGAAGMILFIPFLSILKLISDRSENMKTLSILIGTKRE